ncbi:hypothetical protein PG102015_1594 [Bifidobacterium pseudolongum subsp. globosum]|uniref:hypothetical protein n=1 Tax=Bifidobacterium pseudolongum TaxID=1694 RepID=UPI001021B938|nr:hypothetical protein [Bifidobacterium pseudolongum]RYP93979.1 hypothetical protein PG102015_1594 [Bifidobacterium pseudolongum subsp. globosum]
MSRKLVSIQTIDQIDPIPGADRIVLAHVLGWKVIIFVLDITISKCYTNYIEVRYIEVLSEVI